MACIANIVMWDEVAQKTRKLKVPHILNYNEEVGKKSLLKCLILWNSNTIEYQTRFVLEALQSETTFLYMNGVNV